MVQIANPIYDVVFKYLMNDEKVARLLLSAIIGEEITALDFRPTEHQLAVGPSLTVLRMDFSAKIVDAKGKERLIIIELQKAKFATDIMRFRRYLGEQYANKANVTATPRGEDSPNRKAMPILSIYFLGHPLEHSQSPVIQVRRTYTDAATGEVIGQKEEFIESLTHDSYIIQIRYIKGRHRTELEQLLTVFDQANSADNAHFLQIEEDSLPERYRPVLRRLQKALSDPEVRETMDAEDDIIEELRDYQRIIERKEKELEDRDKALEDKDKALEDKDKALEDKDKALEDRDKALEDNYAKLKNAITMLAGTGLGTQEIADALNLPIDDVVAMLGTKG